MKKSALLLMFSLFMVSSHAQDDEYQRYLESMKKNQEEFKQDADAAKQKISQEFIDYKAKADAEFADYIAKEWQLFEEFRIQELAMSMPKLEEVPQAAETGVTDVTSDEIKFTATDALPQVADIENVNDGYGVGFTPRTDNYVVRKVITNEGVQNVTTDFSSFVKNSIASGQEVQVNFYGKKLMFNVDDKLRVKVKGVKESEVSDYFKEMAKLRNETNALWQQIDNYVGVMGLNEWGYFCILRSLSENIIDDVNSRVLFNFYMLRNEGGFKVKTARGKDSNSLILLAAIDNEKEVYSYTFFRLDDADGKQLKYYLIYAKND